MQSILALGVSQNYQGICHLSFKTQEPRLSCPLNESESLGYQTQVYVFCFVFTLFLKHHQ